MFEKNVNFCLWLSLGLRMMKMTACRRSMTEEGIEVASPVKGVYQRSLRIGVRSCSTRE